MSDTWNRSQTMELNHWARGLSQPSDLRGAVEASDKIWMRFGVYLHEWVGTTIVDVGCGPTARCACFGDSTIIGIDPLADQYRKLPGALMELYSATYARKAEDIVPELIGRADMVVSINCLDHCELPAKVLWNMRSYCKPGGIGFVSVDCSEQPEEMHPSRMSEAELAKTIQSNGWTIDRHFAGRCYPRIHEDGQETWDDGWSPDVIAEHFWLKPR